MAPRAAVCVLVTALAYVSAAAIADVGDRSAAGRGEPAARVFGATSRPRVSFTVEQPETPGGPCHVAVLVLADNGVETRAATFDQAPPASCRPTPAGIEVEGTSRLEGRAFRYRATVSLDWRMLDWREPATVTLRDGSPVELAGRYVRQDEAMQLALAKAAFGAVDRELNAIYRRLVSTRDRAALAALRADQRRWLTYRDFTLFDGDDAESVGPGTSSHVREQSRRTLARIRFLASLLEPPRTDPGDAKFADGHSGTVAVRRVGEALAFSAAVQYPNLNADAPDSVPCTVTGLARPSGARVWLAAADAVVPGDAAWRPEPLRLVLDPEGRLRIEAAGSQPGMLGRVLQATYVPQRRLVPAEAPLRSLLWQLPAAAFDDTTDGLTDAERQRLVLTGAGGSFTLAAETPDRLLLRHHDGRVDLVRLAAADGSAVLAVEQTNGRSLTIQVWRQPAAGGPFVAWNDAVPVLPVGAFSASGRGATTAPVNAGGRQVVHIDATGTLRLSLSVPADRPEPDYAFTLVWDGFGFVAQRTGSR